MSRDRRRVVKNEIHIELEQIDTVPKDLFFDGIAMLGQEIQGSVELRESKIFRFRQPDPIEPALMASQFGAGTIQPLGGHRQQGSLVWRP